MSSKLNNLKLIIAIFIALGVSISLQPLLAWQTPTATPPNSNIAAPINTGSTAQDKSGSLSLGGSFLVAGNAAVSGNVGIGTTNPGALLQIGSTASGNSELLRLGTAYISNSTQRGAITWRDASNITGQIDTRYDGTDVSMVFGHLYHSGYQISDVMTLKNGNVGIGTTNPGSWKLYVNGGNAYMSGLVRADGGFQVDGTTVVDAANSMHYTYGASKYDKFGTVNASGWGVDANNTGNWDLLVYNGGYTYNATTYLGYGGTAAIYTYDTNENLALMPNGTGGVGVGMANPGSYKLNVAGQINASNGLCINGSCLTSWPASVGGSGTANYVSKFTAGSTLGNSQIYDNGTNVGIGTASPAQKLEVNGNLRLSPANPYIYSGSSYIIMPNGLYISGGTLWATNQAQFRGGIHNDNAAYLTIAGGTSGNTYFSGNIGVGTTSPGYKLDVNGTIRSTGDILANGNYGLGLVGVYASTRYQNVFAMGSSYRLAADGTTPGNMYGIAWTHTNVGGQSKSGLSHQALFMANGITQTAIGTGIWTIGDMYLNNNKSIRLDSSANSTLLLGNYYGGSFAYGTTPTASLAVEGDVKANRLCIQENCLNSWSSIAANSGWTDDGMNVRLTTATDNVGIGIATPSYKLHVAGDVYAAGWLRTSGNTGWTNTSYGGGWYMTDTTWIRSYGSKNIYHDTGIMRTDGTFQVGSSGATLNIPNNGNFAYRTNVLFANTSGNVGIGNNAPGGKLQINPSLSQEGLRIVTASNWSPLNIRNSANTADIFRVDQSGILQVGSVPWARITGAPASAVTSVFGRMGAVVATAGDYNTTQITEGTNLYFTNARAQAAITGAASTISTANLTANYALISNASGKVAVSPTITSTELGYLDGVTSAIQTQLNTKALLANPTFTGNVTMPGTGIWNSSGNIGIGTTNPNTMLNIYHSNMGPIINLQGSDLSYRGLKVANTSNSEKWFMGSNNSSSFVVRRNNSVDDITINSLGNFGIGKTPSYKLDVSGQVNATEFCINGSNCISSWQTVAAPFGAIMAFYLSSCPTGWILANGANGTPDLRGMFIRGLDQGRGIDSGRTLGTYQADAFQGHWHEVKRENSDTWVVDYSGGYTGSGVSGVQGGKDRALAKNSISDGANGAPRIAGETRPKNVALIYCMKQ